MSRFMVLLSLVACGGQFGVSKTPLQRDFVLSGAHNGWVVIEYGVDGVSPSPVKDGREQIQIPPGGKIQVSTPYKAGVSNDRYRQANGTAIPTLSDDRLFRSDEHAATRATPFVCCGGTRTYEDVSAGQPQRIFEYFYAGKGPAGTPPTIP